jgi:hypothetical protein
MLAVAAQLRFVSGLLAVLAAVLAEGSASFHRAVARWMCAFLGHDEPPDAILRLGLLVGTDAVFTRKHDGSRKITVSRRDRS